MDVIDDEGNLFGVVNVIDALVLLLALAIVTAGAAFALQSDPLAVLLVLALVTAGAAFALQSDPEPEPPDLSTTNATLDLGTQPDYIVSQLNEGDAYTPTSNTQLTITDVHLTPRGAKTGVLLGVELQGPTNGDTIAYADAPPRLGRTLKIVTDAYQVSGTITDVSSGQTIPTAERNVLLSTTVDAETATKIDKGDTYTLRERTLATVQSVTTYGTNNPDRKRVLVGLTLQARETSDGALFAGRSLAEGNKIPVRTADYQIAGEIQRVGATEPRGDPATRTVTLQLRNVPPQLADSIRTGMTETANGDTLARITAIERENATVVLTSRDGHIYQREHPVNQELTLTAELTVRETTSGVTFKGRTIQQGSTVTLALRSVTVTATVVAL